MARKRTFYQLRYFVCPMCANKQTASKSKGQTNNGHKKTMWCPVCGKEQEFVQYDFEMIHG